MSVSEATQRRLTVAGNHARLQAAATIASGVVQSMFRQGSPAHAREVVSLTLHILEDLEAALAPVRLAPVPATKPLRCASTRNGRNRTR